MSLSTNRLLTYPGLRVDSKTRFTGPITKCYEKVYGNKLSGPKSSGRSTHQELMPKSNLIGPLEILQIRDGDWSIQSRGWREISDTEPQKRDRLTGGRLCG